MTTPNIAVIAYTEKDRGKSFHDNMLRDLGKTFWNNYIHEIPWYVITHLVNGT